jgi:excinuclease ABC subunit A
MVNTLFVLDEPSVGLHSRDTGRLVEILKDLRDAGNTVVVVEHEANVMMAADQIVDLGPGQGEAGGQIVFQGDASSLMDCPDSLTGQYLGGKRQAALPENRSMSRTTGRLVLRNANRHNLDNLSVEIPLNRFVCLTGVSGSGKTTLAREVLLPLLEARLRQGSGGEPSSGAEDSDEPEDASPGEMSPSSSAELVIEGELARVMLVDQSSLGRTPRSNPVVYVGAFNDIRELFAQTETARQQGLKASSFSFNSALGQCERCRGAGFEKIEMQFLSDVFIRCPDCDGRRYRDHILKIKLPVAASDTSSGPQDGEETDGGWSIADLLESTVDRVCLGLLPYQSLPAGSDRPGLISRRSPPGRPETKNQIQPEVVPADLVHFRRTYHGIAFP